MFYGKKTEMHEQASLVFNICGFMYIPTKLDLSECRILEGGSYRKPEKI